MQPLRSSFASEGVAKATPREVGPGADAVTEVADRVLRLVESQVHVRIPSNDADLFLSGAVDSLSLVEILMRLEEEFETHIRLDELELADFRSVSSIARLLARSGLGR